MKKGAVIYNILVYKPGLYSNNQSIVVGAVSYTHLDVYKRQGNIRARGSQQQFHQPRSRPAVDAQAQFIPPALGGPRLKFARGVFNQEFHPQGAGRCV